MTGRDGFFNFGNAEQARSAIRKGWWAVGISFVIGWGFQAYCGVLVYTEKPPIPDFFVHDPSTNATDPLFKSTDVLDGQQVWQSFGGHHMGSIWGHGSLQAPDWSTDWLHQEALLTLAEMHKDEPETGASGDAEAAARDETIKAAVYKMEVRRNTYKESTNAAWILPARARAVAKLKKYYIALFTGERENPVPEIVLDPPMDLPQLRKLYNMKENTLVKKDAAEKLTAFFFWSAWAAVAQRQVEDTLGSWVELKQQVSYTNNWPPEDLVGNHMPADFMWWTFLSICLLLIGIASLGYWYFANHEEVLDPPEQDPFQGLVITPSMRSLEKWVWTAFALTVVNLFCGYYLGHMAINEDPQVASWFKFPDVMTQNLTYAVMRTWHLQSVIFFIAVSFLAGGLFMAPTIIGGRTEDPPFQLLGCNFLYICTVVIVAGSFIGELAAVHQMFEDMTMSYWFGHQGYEYIELGRFYQVFLCIGIVLWLVLMVNAIWPALDPANPCHNGSAGKWHLTWMIVLSGALIGTLYLSGLMYGPRSNLAVMEYWRWWVVHIWVEGIFEVFSTIIVGYFFTLLQVITPEQSATASLFAASIFMFGGLPGMFHHLYFTGTSMQVVAIGASFSALEVVPLALMGYEAAEYLARIEAAAKKPGHWMSNYKSIVRFFVSVSFWNFFGAGVLGFLINTPASLYYTQCTYLTLSHAHGATWGVYGCLSMALCLIILRLCSQEKWDTKMLDNGLNIMNFGMLVQLFFSVIPVGFLQFHLSLSEGYWQARSHTFHNNEWILKIKLMRIVGDLIFGFGLMCIIYFVGSLATTRRSSKEAAGREVAGVAEKRDMLVEPLTG